MNAVERYERLCEKVRRLESQAERTKGSIDQLTRRLEEEHGCEGLLQARRKVEGLVKEADSLERKAGRILDRLERSDEG